MDNLEDPNALDDPGSPVNLMADERSVYPNLFRLVGLFSPFLHDLYERRIWERIDKVISKNAGARLVATLSLAVASNELATDTEADKALLRRFQLFGPPGTIFFDASGAEVRGTRVIGFQSAQRFGQSLAAAGL